MSVSLIIISVLILLVMFGVGQRILDSLRLTDQAALLILVAIAVGIVIKPIWIGEYFCFSIGGFLIPLALSIYLLISVGWSRDLVRTIVGTIIVGGIIYAVEWIMPADPEEMVVDNMYIYGVIAGITAYALGRSRRNAFISCLFGLTLAELVQWIINYANGNPSILGLGVGGAFGTYIVSIIIAVAVSEFIGRCFECATVNKEKKEFNYETGTYDSEKNGKLDKTESFETEKINEIKLDNANVIEDEKYENGKNGEDDFYKKSAKKSDNFVKKSEKSAKYKEKSVKKNKNNQNSKKLKLEGK